MKVELVGVSFAVDFGHDVLVVVVAQRPAQLVVVHVGLGLALAPLARDLVGICELKLAVCALSDLVDFVTRFGRICINMIIPPK